MGLKMIILGSGTSTGVPIPTCGCKVCRSKNPKNQRLRASAWFQVDNRSLLIDTATDFRYQALRAKINKIDAVLFTHPHADHIHGIDELRSFNYTQKSAIPIYGNEWTTTELKKKFDYIFEPTFKRKGGGIPKLVMHTFDSKSQDLEVSGISVIPISVMHGSKESVGYRIQSVAYITDCSYIPPGSYERLKDLAVLVLDCVRLKPHDTHLNLQRALEVIARIKPKKAYLTHLGHEFDYQDWKKRLPKQVFLAYDGLKISTV